MRMCGHAHHDDMLYLGRDPVLSWDYPPLAEPGYADRELYDFWSARDPISTYAARLERDGIIATGDLEQLKRDAEAMVEREGARGHRRAVAGAVAARAGRVCERPAARRSRGAGSGGPAESAGLAKPDAPARSKPGRHSMPKGRTFLDGVMLGVGDALRADPRVFVYGEDVGGEYGNAFLLLRPLLKEFGDRILNSPLAEGAVLGVCVGAALAGQRPIGEMQFNDFVATGFNQLVNNAAKIRYRWGG